MRGIDPIDCLRGLLSGFLGGTGERGKGREGGRKRGGGVEEGGMEKREGGRKMCTTEQMIERRGREIERETLWAASESR